MAEQSPAEGWRHEGGGRQLVRVHRVTVDRTVFFRGNNELRRVEFILSVPGLPDCTVIGCDAYASVVHHWNDKGFTPPAPKADLKCRPHGERGVDTLGGTLIDFTGVSA